MLTAPIYHAGSWRSAKHEGTVDKGSNEDVNDLVRTKRRRHVQSPARERSSNNLSLDSSMPRVSAGRNVRAGGNSVQPCRVESSMAPTLAAATCAMRSMELASRAASLAAYDVPSSRPTMYFTMHLDPSFLVQFFQVCPTCSTDSDVHSPHFWTSTAARSLSRGDATDEIGHHARTHPLPAIGMSSQRDMVSERAGTGDGMLHRCLIHAIMPACLLQLCCWYTHSESLF